MVQRPLGMSAETRARLRLSS